jgi:hypothetical protein
VVVAFSVLVVLVAGLVIGSRVPAATAAQPTSTGDTPAVIGSWLVFETNPPAGGDPVLAGVATFFADGNALITFGDQRYQGSWVADDVYGATFTVVAPSAGGLGAIDQLRGSVEVATDGGPFRGIYTFDTLQADGTSIFTYRGPIGGQRIDVQAPEPYP